MRVGEIMKDIATKANTMYLLEKYNLKASKKYGQNFLIDLKTIQRIVESTHINKETCVIEIGPGIGALTEQLAKQAKHVVCYEIDERLKDVLAESLSEFDSVEIIFQDFLTVDLKQVVDQLKQSYSQVCIVANLPYYITTDILEHILVSGASIDRIHAMVQKEVAIKLTDSSFKSPLTFMIESLGRISIDMGVSRYAFDPAPRVDSAIISITIEKPFHKNLMPLLKQAFQQKRKTIYNNLKGLFLENTKEILEKCHIEERKRPEELKIEDYITLTKYM